MSEFKGTKGEWRIGVLGSVQNERGEFICQSEKSTATEEENKANNLLIACAPEMLEKLKETLDVLKWYMNNAHPEDGQHESFFNIGMNDVTQIEELINKATE